MTCWQAKRDPMEASGNRVSVARRAQVEEHLREWMQCGRRVQEGGMIPKLLSQLPRAEPPSDLHSRLCVAGSQHRKLMLDGSRMERLWKAFRYRLDELMRPITLSACGGFSSLLLFSALALTISTNAQIVKDDVPVWYEEHTDANLVPVELRSSVILTFSLNSNGRITDYHFHNQAGAFAGDMSHLQTSNISYPEMPSVLAVARPISSDISICLTPIVFRP